MQRCAGLILAILVLAGCSQPASVAPPGPDPRDTEIEHLKKTIEDIKSLQDIKTSALDASFDLERQEYQEQIAALKVDLAKKDKKIAELEEERERLSKAVAALQAREEAKAAAPPAPPVNTAAASPEVGSAADPQEFPVRVFRISGQQKITGMHSVERPVETDETYRDEFGNRQKVTRWVRETVPEYGYFVNFSIANPGDATRSVSVRAGSVTEDFELEPGQVLSDQSVVAAKGSPLLIMVGGQSRSFPVNY